MKLSSQPASVLLPLSSKIAPAALLARDAFAATMRDLVVSPSGPVVAAVIRGPAGGLLQAAARIRSFTLRQEVRASPEQQHIGTDTVSLPTSIVAASNVAAQAPPDEMEHPITPQSSVQGSSPIEESPKLPIPTPAVTNSIEEGVLPHPPPAPREPGLMSNTHTPSRLVHKTDTAKRDSTNPPTAHSPETLPAAATSAQCPLPLSMPQPNRPEQASSEKNAQPAIHSFDKAGGSRHGASMSWPLTMTPTTASDTRSEFAQVGQKEASLEKLATSMNSQPPGPMSETISRTLLKFDQNILPGPAVHSKESHETTASQVDAHASQEAGRPSSAVTKPVLTVEPAIHPALDLSPGQRPPSANTTPDPSPATQRPEILTEIHRAQANAAQVLQRMDTAAPSGALQLRADARHLDVGVSSGVLGWVEVRATASSSGRVDAVLHVQNGSSAHMLTAQTKEIATYAREHSVELGQLSVGVGTGDGARDHSRSMQDEPHSGDTALGKRALKMAVSNEAHQPAEQVSFISIQA